MIGTFWSLIPAIVAIALALISKQVYFSLFIGIVLGGVFYSVDAGSGLSGFLDHVFSDGLIHQVSNSYNAGILIFLVVLGTMVALMNKAGGSAAFGNWAKDHIKTKIGAQLATIFLGVLIFIDDYFNCLTVGSVMKPVTDRHGISREKLAFLIDSTAAPVCIIAPISSWAAAVSGFVTEGENGLSLFCRAIPYNFYALFTIAMMICFVVFKIDFKAMSKFDDSKDYDDSADFESDANSNGKVIDLIIPISVLIVSCTLGMIYSGGFFQAMKESSETGVLVPNETYLNFIEAFANSSASVGLVIGSFLSLVVTISIYLVRKILSFEDAMNCISKGFKAMVPAILILSLAWTLKSMTDSLGAKEYVASIVSGKASYFQNFLPALIFIISGFLAFSTGTSWGTFGILIPICIAVFPEAENPLRTISISACMAGAVFGDHISPISDTTIMASAGAKCNHVNHVSSQIPYALSCASVSFLTYIFAGFVKNPIVSLIFGAALISGLMVAIRKIQKNAVRALKAA